jgi:hypothetical protein
METFYIKFHMNNGEKIEIEEKQNPSYDFMFTLKKADKWLESENKIINLDNVNFIEIETETQRKKHDEVITKAFTNWNTY